MLSFASCDVSEFTQDKFNCMASFLKKKGQLEDEFKYSPTTLQPNCENDINELADSLLNKTVARILKKANADDEDGNDFVIKYFEPNAECFHNSFREVNLKETFMKLLVYQFTPKLTKKQKKKIETRTDDELNKKFTLAASLCVPDEVFGEMFDEKFEPDEDDDGEEDDLEGLRTDYCVRQYVVEKKLIDPKTIEMDMNPFAVETNFDCTDYVEDYLEVMEEEIENHFHYQTEQPRRQLRCISRTIRNHKASEYMMKVYYLNAGTIKDDLKAEERQKFIQFMLGLFKDLTKC
jgi:hypothetical protein